MKKNPSPWTSKYYAKYQGLFPAFVHDRMVDVSNATAWVYTKTQPAKG